MFTFEMRVECMCIVYGVRRRLNWADTQMDKGQWSSQWIFSCFFFWVLSVFVVFGATNSPDLIKRFSFSVRSSIENFSPETMCLSLTHVDSLAALFIGRIEMSSCRWEIVSYCCLANFFRIMSVIRQFNSGKSERRGEKLWTFDGTIFFRCTGKDSNV